MSGWHVALIALVAFGIGYRWGLSVMASRMTHAIPKGWTLEDFYRRYFDYKPPPRYPDS